jgi:hypothetical protein
MCTPDPDLPISGHRRRGNRVVLVVVIFVTMLAYAITLAYAGVPAALLVPTTVGVAEAATRIVRRGLSPVAA